MTIAKPAKLAHVVYRTRRFSEMIEWYKTVFGAKVQYENPGFAFLTFDDEHHRFGLANMEVLAPNGDSGKRAEVGVDHVGYTYDSIGDLLENYQALRDQGISPYWTIHHGVTASMYYQDPDGNQMEFQVDCFPTVEANRYMVESFAKNPVGVEYDAEEWLARYRAGEPAAAFLERTIDEPVSPIRGQFEELLA